MRRESRNFDCRTLQVQGVVSRYQRSSGRRVDRKRKRERENQKQRFQASASNDGAELHCRLHCLRISPSNSLLLFSSIRPILHHSPLVPTDHTLQMQSASIRAMAIPTHATQSVACFHVAASPPSPAAFKVQLDQFVCLLLPLFLSFLSFVLPCSIQVMSLGFALPL